MLWNASAIAGYTIKTSDGQTGTVNDLIVEDSEWTVHWLSAGTAGWLTGGQVLIPVSALGRPDPDAQEVPVNLTMRQIERSPEIDPAQPLAREVEDKIFAYYRQMSGPGRLAGEPWGSAPIPRVLGALPPGLLGPQGLGPPVLAGLAGAGLHGLASMIGNGIAATDGDIGHVAEFLIDTLAWEVRFIAVNTAHWWPGERVLISPRSVERIDTASGVLRLDVDRRKVKDSPPYDMAATADGAFEEQFQTYYGIRFGRK